MLADILEGVFCHEALQVSVLLDDMGRLKVVDVGALHTESDEDLPAYIEPPPALHREEDTLVLCPKLLTYLLEANFLNDLETIDGLAPQTLRCKLLGDQVSDHGLQPHSLPSEGKPHAGELLHMVQREACWYRPVWRGNIGD